MSLMHLAGVYANSGRGKEAEARCTCARLQFGIRRSARIIPIREKLLGLDHPWTKATREALDALEQNGARYGV